MAESTLRLPVARAAGKAHRPRRSTCYVTVIVAVTTVVCQKRRPGTLASESGDMCTCIDVWGCMCLVVLTCCHRAFLAAQQMNLVLERS